MTKRAIHLTWLLGVLFAAGCMSAGKRYEDASEDESEGRWASACEKYLDVLRRDSEFPGAREKAQETGKRAIAGWLRVADGFEGNGRFDSALGEVAKVDGLVDRAAAVGVVLDTRDGYAAWRLSLHHRASERALASADVSAAEGRWQEAAGKYRRALSRYELTQEDRERALDGTYTALLAGARAEFAAGNLDRSEQLAQEATAVYGRESPRVREAAVVEEQVKEARFGALLDAAALKMEEGHYQEAYAIVQQAIAVYGEDSSLSRPAWDLQGRIVAEGTVHVALTPARAGTPARMRVPAALLGEIDSRLEENPCTPPMFVAVVDPQTVRREMRRLGFDEDVPSDHRAATLGQEVGAQVMAVLYVEQCAYGGGGAPEQRTATTRAGGTVAFDLYRHRTLDVRCAFRLVDTRTGRLLSAGTVDASAVRRHAHAQVDRRTADELLLTRDEHAWFDLEKLRTVDRDLEREVAGNLAERLTTAIHEEVVRRLP